MVEAVVVAVVIAVVVVAVKATFHSKNVKTSQGNDNYDDGL